jgi:hypothetical protein
MISQLVFDDVMNECVRDGFDEYLTLPASEVAVDLLNAGTFDEFPEVNEQKLLEPRIKTWQASY